MIARHASLTRRPQRLAGLLLLLVVLLVPSVAAGATGAQRASGGTAQAVTPGTVVAWGGDSRGELGDGTVGPSNPTPTTVPGLSGITAFAAGGGFSLALKADGTLLAWGSDASGQLGDGTVGPNTNPTPQAVPGVGGIIAIAAGFSHSLALKSDHTVLSWGQDAYGQLGDGTVGPNNPTPTAVPGVSDIAAIAAGGTHSVALKSDGTLLIWGSDFVGELGDGTVGSPSNNPTPKAVPGVSGVKAIAVGVSNTLALKTDGTLVIWGGDDGGQLGDGTVGSPDNNPTPAAVPGVSGIAAIAMGSAHALALKADGTLLAWGGDAAGQLGDGTAEPNNPTPTAVPGVSGVAAIDAGQIHSLVLKTDGTVLTWGTDASGEGGDGTVGSPNTNPTPTVVTGLSGVAAIAAGGTFNLALVPAPSASPSPSPSPGATRVLTVVSDPDGAVSGAGSYPQGSTATAIATPADGFLFTGWAVDDVPQGWAPSITITMDDHHALRATFVAKPAFTDVPATDPAAAAIANLAARGIIRGCFTDPATQAKDFCPDDATLRHQMAALIVRAIPGWANETGLPSFGDNTSDTELMTRVATLQRHDVVKGYPADVCRERGIATPPGCYGPLDTVKYGQVMLFVARAMVQKGYWTLQADDRTIFPDQNGAANADPNTDQQTLDHRHVVTYVHYVGSVPDVADTHANFAVGTAHGVRGWADNVPRSWFARAFWPALQTYFGTDIVP